MICRRQRGGGRARLGRLALGAAALALLAGASAPAAARRVDLDLHRRSAGTVLRHSEEGAAPPTPSAATARYELVPTPDGGYAYAGPNFDARVSPDGGVTFSTPGHLRFPPGGPQPTSTPGRDPTVGGRDPWQRGGGETLVVESRPGARFDVTDEYMHMLGRDAARTQKADFLAATFDVRMRLAADAARDRRREALEELPSELDALWNDARRSHAERRHLLHAIWDDLGGRGPGAEQARAVVRGFVQHHLSPAEASEFK